MAVDDEKRQHRVSLTVKRANVFARLPQAHTRRFDRQDLSSLNIPALFVFGQQDTLTPLSLSLELHEGIHDSQIVIIPNAGHISNVDNADAL